MNTGEPSPCVPTNAFDVENDWKALKISGVLEFSMVGVIATISNILASVDISIFVISTYNTDYVLLKKTNYVKAIQELIKSGYVIK